MSIGWITQELSPTVKGRTLSSLNPVQAAVYWDRLVSVASHLGNCIDTYNERTCFERTDQSHPEAGIFEAPLQVDTH